MTFKSGLKSFQNRNKKDFNHYFVLGTKSDIPPFVDRVKCSLLNMVYHLTSAEYRITKGSIWKWFYMWNFHSLASNISKMYLSNNINAGYLSKEIFSDENSNEKGESFFAFC